MNLKIDPRGIPSEGYVIEGQLPASFFDLDPSDSAQAISPLEYSLTITRDEDDLIFYGDVAATFELECGRCAEKYQTRISLSPYGQNIEIENQEPIDLTTILREDTLLALPTYPRCEQGNLSPRECPAEGRFSHEQEDLPNEASPADSQTWEALDQLKNNLKRN
jgi:uncharacterized protein